VNVRGITVLTRKNVVTRQFGAETWRELYRDVAASHACLRSFVTNESLVPLPAYLALHDQIVKRLLGDDERAHAELGRQSARWALASSPYKTFLEQQGIDDFVNSFPKLWTMYFTDTTSRSEAVVSGNSVEFKAFDLPEWHPYLEHFVMGYMAEALEMFCANPIVATRVRGGVGRHYHYLLHASPVTNDDGEPRKSRAGREAAKGLSDREMEVLMLVADGMTNEQIGLTLGISGKTAQHHVAHAYRKIGVTSRVGATVWLAERGFVGK
jgi:DNA-binding CsgD family transcriptional regulator